MSKNTAGTEKRSLSKKMVTQSNKSISWEYSGESALTLLSVWTGVPKTRPTQPYDPADFRRCVEMLALEIMPDHVHLFVGATPNHKPFEIVKQIKGYSSHEMRKVLWEARQLGYVKPWKKWKALWARGYYCGSAGHVSQDAVKRYILEQQHKPNVFEYSIFGDSKGTTRIGDFTQKKLDGW